MTFRVNAISDLNKLCGDGSAKYIYKRKSKRCLFGLFFRLKTGLLVLHPNEFLIFDCTVYPDCHSGNVIYLITCSRCSLQYAGETGQNINKRFHWHKVCFKNPQKHGFYYLIISIKECMKILHIQLKFRKKSDDKWRNVLGAQHHNMYQ